jgi:diguanylate cyclase (GGDEF)-like protein
MVLALHFNRSRAFFVLLLLLSFYWYAGLPARVGAPPSSVPMLYGIFAFLLPANITLFCLMREKGILTPAGRKRFAFLVIQAALFLLVEKTGQAGEGMVPAATQQWTCPALALPLMSVCFLSVAVKSCFSGSLIDSGFLGVLAAIALPFTVTGGGDAHTVFLFAAGFMLILSILQDSHNMAYRDDLTGLLSRRALNEQLEGLGRRYVVAMLDLDHFKKLNDMYGHDTGDQVLRMTAARIRAVGGGGKAYRYGGEEFTILFPGKRAEEALPHLESLRAEIASYRFRIRSCNRSHGGRGQGVRGMGRKDETRLSVTVSIGVAEGNRRSGPPREVVAAADEALYRAKQRGRNRISMATVS